MTRRQVAIGLAAGAVAVAAAIFALYQAKQWAMPDPLAVALAVLGWGALVTLFTLMVYHVVRMAGETWAFRWPMVRKDAPNPHQRLLDIAKEDATNPAAAVKILKAELGPIDLRPEIRRPWVQLMLTLYNGGVHSVIVGPAHGHVAYDGELWEKEMEGQSGAVKPRGHVGPYRLTQYVPKELAQKVYEEICTGQLRSFGMGHVSLEVRAETDGAEPVRMPLGDCEVFTRPR